MVATHAVYDQLKLTRLEGEIAKLHAENERLRAALKAIAQNDCAQRGCDVYEMAKAALADQGVTVASLSGNVTVVSPLRLAELEADRMSKADQGKGSVTLSPIKLAEALMDAGQTKLGKGP